MPIPDAISSLENATMISFIIENNIVAKPTRSLVTLWSPWVQLGLNDGTDNPESSHESSFRQVTKKPSIYFEKYVILGIQRNNVILQSESVDWKAASAHFQQSNESSQHDQ